MLFVWSILQLWWNVSHGNSSITTGQARIRTNHHGEQKLNLFTQDASVGLQTMPWWNWGWENWARTFHNGPRHQFLSVPGYSGHFVRDITLIHFPGLVIIGPPVGAGERILRRNPHWQAGKSIPSRQVCLSLLFTSRRARPRRFRH